MYVARILYPVEVLGPGKRVGIWFCGCPRRCNGCSNPELWEFDDKYKTAPDMVIQLINKIAKSNVIDGFTITGGDPFYQAEDLMNIIKALRKISNDILVYTGYKIDEIPKENLEGISVLIDGEYIESQNNNCILRGSENQTIHVLDKELRDKYDLYCSSYENQIQNFMTLDGIVSVGIHKPNFINDLNNKLSTKGMINNE